MKKVFLFLFASVMFVLSWTVIAMAQAAASAPVSASGGIMGWINAHGGVQMSALLLVYSANAILSAVRDVCCKLDGINPGDVIPANKQALTIINKVCIALGKVIDFIQGNVQH